MVCKFQDVIMSQFEYKCCINMLPIIKHYYACIDVLQDCLMPECLITYYTAVRVLTTMYVSKCYQSALLTKCLLTHIKY